MTSPRPLPAAPPPSRAWRRAAVILAVLAGLFLMHGISAAGGGACHGAAPPGLTDAAMPMTIAGPGAPAVHPTTAPVISHASGMSEATGDSCTPLRPDGPAGLLLALGLALTCFARRVSGFAGLVRAVRREWAHGPPRPGAALLCELSVCRT